MCDYHNVSSIQQPNLRREICLFCLYNQDLLAFYCIFEQTEYYGDRKRSITMVKKAILDNRMHVVIPPAIQDRLEAVKKNTGANTSSEVVREALKIYFILHDEHIKGSEFLIRSKTGEIEKVRVFFWDSTQSV